MRTEWLDEILGLGAYADAEDAPLEDGILRLPVSDALPRPVVVSMGDIVPQPVDWVAETYIPRGKLTLIAGDPGSGKSQLVTAIASAFSTGGHFPGRSEAEPQHVLMVISEDGLEDTVRPRLDAMDADVSHIKVLRGVLYDDGERPLLLDEQGLVALEIALQEHSPRLVLLDLLADFFGRGVDTNRQSDVGAVLRALGTLTDRYKCAILGTVHVNKAEAMKALYRVSGAMSFVGKARSVLFVAKDPDNPMRRVMAHLKSNLAPEGASQAFSLADGQFGWIGEVLATADDLARHPRTEEERSALAEAQDFIRVELADGPKPNKYMQNAAKEYGISVATLRRARESLAVKPWKDGGRDGGWMRSLAEQEEA
jgi:energy-coupling factor transporter ATP-binding protein EcfA2